MKCPQCGKELKESTKFCDACGCPVAPTEPAQPNNQQTPPTPPMPQPQQPKKKFYKQWYFWVIIVVAVILIGCINGAINGGSNSKKPQEENAGSTQSYTSANVETTVEPATEEETTEEPTTQEPTKDPAQTEQEFKNSCSTISFEDLSRNPDKYKGDNYKFTGQVIQVQEGWFDTVELRINVTKEEFEYIDDVMWTDTIYATVTIPEGADKLLEDDVITFWGTCDGNYSYTSVLGNQISLPEIDIKYYELNN